MQESRDLEIKKLEEENKFLKEELERINKNKARKRNVFTKIKTISKRIVLGTNLSTSHQDLINEISLQKVKRNTLARFGVSILHRFTRISLIGVFFAIVSLSFVLLQVLLLRQQNKYINVQNKYIHSQTELFSNQNYLAEAARRSNMLISMNDLFQTIQNELENNKERKLSSETVGRIISLSQILKPYKFLDSDNMTITELSPERAYLLIFLIEARLAKSTYHEIFISSNFEKSDLRNIVFREAYLAGANLKNSDFTNSTIYKSDFFRAKLDSCKLININRGNNISGNGNYNLSLNDLTAIEVGDFSHASLRGSTVKNCDLNSGYFWGTIFYGSRISNCNLANGCIAKSNFVNCKIDSINLDNSVFVFNNIKNSEAWGLEYNDIVTSQSHVKSNNIFNEKLDSLSYYKIKGDAHLSYKMREYFLNKRNFLKEDKAFLINNLDHLIYITSDTNRINISREIYLQRKLN